MLPINKLDCDFVIKNQVFGHNRGHTDSETNIFHRYLFRLEDIACFAPPSN